MKDTRPNILLITCDQLRYDYVGAYGCDFIETPNIDRLAGEGCLFVNAYSPNPVCIPARHNLLTGLTARHHGFDDNYFGESAKAAPYYLPTFPQILSDSGYETVAIGKMHFQPERRMNGFDYFYNMNELPPTREADDYAMFLKEKGYGHLSSPHGVRTCLYMQPQRSLVPEKYHGSAWVADRAIDYLDSNRGRMPFLMWAGFIHPHPPFDIPESYAGLYQGKVGAPARSETPLSTLAQENITLGCLENPEALNRVRELYASAVTFADHQIGRIMEKLRELDLYENTVIVFTSDHGEMLGDLGTFQKFLPYDASCRIPMIVRYPSRLQAGTKEERFVDLNDILPSFLDAAGVRYPADYDLPGESFFVKEGVKNRRYQYAEHQHGSKRWCMIRDERYKYVYYFGDEEQLFDMVRDPKETRNLLYGKAEPEILQIRGRLKEVLTAYESRYGLKDGVVGGELVKREAYQMTHYYETNAPEFPSMLVRPEEKAAMMKYDDEILAALKGEKSVKLSENHTKEILKQIGYEDEWIDCLIERAGRQGN